MNTLSRKTAQLMLVCRYHLSAHLDQHNSGVLVVNLAGGGGGSRDVSERLSLSGEIGNVLVTYPVLCLCSSAGLTRQTAKAVRDNAQSCSLLSLGHCDLFALRIYLLAKL